MQPYFSLFLIIILIFFGCESLTQSDQLDGEYPTVLPVLSSEEQIQLTEEYQNLNGNGFCASVNNYGLNGNKICTDNKTLRKKVTEADKPHLLKVAEAFLEKNQKFTNVNNASRLEVDDISDLYGCIKCDGSPGDGSTIGLKITYKKQSYKGLPIENSQITVFTDAKKVYRVNGHWYPDIIVPDSDQLDFDDAREVLLGNEFTYDSWIGESSVQITEDSFGDFEDKSIFPFETEKGVELRVSLVVSAGIWHFYIDSTTGEILHKEQTIMF